ncbi:MAG: universal stress protein [Flavobacteriales bacterium]|nr:universal stress protein [Flavobacteriales bacterium]
MTHILLPTDFSDTALKAAHFAMDLYGTSDVRYTLVNSTPVKASADPLLPDLTRLMEQQSLSGLRQAERRLRKRPGHVYVAKVSTYAALPVALNNLAERKGADLIVMGTQGKSSKRLFGSNASTVVKKTLLPVITVPAHWQPEPVRRILLPMDNEAIDERTFLPLRDLVHRCRAEVVVAHVRTNAVGARKGVDRAAMGKALKGIKHSYITAHGPDVVDTMNELAAGGRIQLVAMVQRKRSFLGGLFHRSSTRQMALHTKLPLLVLRQG